MPCPFTLVSDHLLKTKEKQKLDTSIKFQIILNEKKKLWRCCCATQDLNSGCGWLHCNHHQKNQISQREEKRGLFFFCYLRLWL
jgi:hypothetical protein